jgi:hypothetical protein
MKKIVLLFSILSLLLVFNACSSEGTLFDFEGKDFWSFRSARQNFIADETGKVGVYLHHLSDGKLTPVTVSATYSEGAEELFSVATTSFNTVDERGRAVIEIAYNVEDLEYNTPYTVTLSVPVQDYPRTNGLITTVTVEIRRPLTFSSIGTGVFLSEWLEEEKEQPVMLANQATIYRLLDLYDTGYHIDIIDNGDGTVTIESQPAWFDEEWEEDVNVVGTGTKVGNVITMQLDHYYPSDGWSFGVFEEVLTLP